MARKYIIETFGCQMNEHDSERLAGALERDGYVEARSVSEADVVVLNTCSVRERAVEKLYSRLGEIRADRPAAPPVIAVTGCVAQQEGRSLARRPGVDVVVGTQALPRLAELLEMVQAPGRPRRPAVDVNAYEDVGASLGAIKRGDPVKAYVTISEGCNDHCAFCVVPFTRGHERMRPVRQILAECRDATSSGRREVQLLGQIVNHYHAPDDPSCDFAELLRRVCRVEGVERVRFASPHPRHVTPELIEVMGDLPKLCRHVHLPVQSGSTRILAAMRRRHTREQYLALVERFRRTVPDVAISTDMIVGFPGESDADFEETLSLVGQVRFTGMFSFKYSPRPSTLAGTRMADDVPEPEKARRLSALQALQRHLQSEFHERAVGTVQRVLLDAVSRRRDAELAGRTSGNTVVNLPGRPQWVGRFADVRIERGGPNSLWGRPVWVEP